MEFINTHTYPAHRGWVFSYIDITQIGGELMKKAIAFALAAAGAFLIYVNRDVIGKEVKYRVG